MLLIVAHALRHVKPESESATLIQTNIPQPTQLVLTPQLLDALRAALVQVTVTEGEVPQSLLSPHDKQRANAPEYDGEQEANVAQEARAEQGEVFRLAMCQ